jgi:hypothetical protein
MIELQIKDVHIYVHVIQEDATLNERIHDLEQRLSVMTEKLQTAMTATQKGTNP